MANFFDQFDGLASTAPKTTAKPGANFFDQFDAAPAANKNDLGSIASQAADQLMIGLPITGSIAHKAGAAIDAAATGVGRMLGVDQIGPKDPFSQAPDFATRMAENEAAADAKAKAFEAEHPVVSTVARMGGGVLGTIPAVALAPAAFGVGAMGIPASAALGGLSGGAVGAADALARGEDPGDAAMWGAAGGAGGNLAARGIGAVARAFRGRSAPVPQNTLDVNGVPVPVTEGQITQSPAHQAEEQIILNGGRGEKAQQLALEAKAAQQDALDRANAKIAAGLDPTGTSPATTPHAAGSAVLDELTAAEQTRFQTEAAARARATAEAEKLRGQLGQHLDAQGNPAVASTDSPYAAGEAVGTGVTRARDAAAGRTRELYGAVRDEPGTFDPSVPRTMADEIRARVNTGEDPLWVDPQTAGVANDALRLIDKTIGSQSALFHNTAAPAGVPVGPVAAASAAPVLPVAADAERTLAALTAMGVNPARARAAVRLDVPGGVLAPHDVAVPGGGSVSVVPKVVEAGAIRTSADVGYDPALQPRNRARAASDAQINDISKNLNPERLGRSSEADRGAPIIGPDGLVESGNGRVLALRKAYADNGSQAQRYRQWLQSQGADVAGMKEPVLVRERTTPMSSAERKAFTVSANQSSTLSLSAPERALADARTLRPDTLSLIRNPSDLLAVENRDFVRSFMQGVPASERGALMTASGDLSSEGLTRIRNAVLGKAYGDTPILSRIAESTNDEVKSISNALTSAAPEWARLRTGVASGAVPAELDATPHLLDAVTRTARIRGKGVGLADSRAQSDAFSVQSPESEQFQRLFYDADGQRAAPSARIAEGLRHYAQEAAKVDASPGLGLGLPPVTASDVLNSAAARVGAPPQLAKSVIEAAAPPIAKAIPEVGLREMDAARKRLVTMYGDAKRAAMAPGGSRADERAMRRIVHEFDNVILDAFENGRFSGDSEAAKRLLMQARASHAAYRQTFTPRGSGDDVGRAVQKILGRYSDNAAGPDEIAKLSYGSVGNPGGSQAARVAQRLKTILGPTSPEWGAFKQGLLAHLIDAPEGATWSPAQKATRIEKYLKDPHAQIVLAADERAGLKGLADNLRATEPASPSSFTSVDKAIARLSGRDGGPPATTRDAVDMLFGDSRTGTGNKISVPLALRLKRDLSPEGFTAVRQGAWSRVTSAGEGKIPFEAQALSQRLHEFLNGKGKDLAKSLFTAEERRQMQTLASAYSQMIPAKGSTNPSGTAAALTRIANKASQNLLAMLGGIHGGFVGAAVGHGVERAARAIGNSRNARAAVRSFYGAQPRAPGVTSPGAVLVSQGAVPAVSDRRR
jgi:VIT1/CCC1 family predicted Fe2+/Mn2+ transporter